MTITKTKVHLGCGKRNFGPDWYHIDGTKFDHVDSFDIVHLPFKDDSMDLLYASHVIAYFDRTEVIDLFKEWNRVLKPGGILRVATPNFDQMAYLYIEKDMTLDKFVGPLYGKMEMDGKTIYHKTVYDEDSLCETFLKSGFVSPRYWYWEEVDHGIHDDHSQAYIPHMDKKNGALISLNMEAVKPQQ